MNNDGLNIRHIYNLLFNTYGPQHWWPAETPFEVMVGAVLTQNTAWRNVERAIANLANGHALEPELMMTIPEEELAELIRPAGYFRIKAKRLRTFCAFYHEHGQWKRLSTMPTETLRTKLLGVHGIGPETADSILLYAFDRPAFVIDTYTKRIFRRLGLSAAEINYEELQQFFHDLLPDNISMFNEYHALIVEHAKRHCRAKPVCSGCPLLNACCTGSVTIQHPNPFDENINYIPLC